MRLSRRSIKLSLILRLPTLTHWNNKRVSLRRRRTLWIQPTALSRKLRKLGITEIQLMIKNQVTNNLELTRIMLNQISTKPRESTKRNSRRRRLLRIPMRKRRN